MVTNPIIAVFALAVIAASIIGFAAGRVYSDPRCYEDEVVISWHTGYTCEPLDNLPLELQRRVDE